MTSLKQIEANRRNALKSTGPTSTSGKDRARRNALRQGFTADIVLEPLENAEKYPAFEAAILSEYLPQTPVEQELVRRLASLFGGSGCSAGNNRPANSTHIGPRPDRDRWTRPSGMVVADHPGLRCRCPPAAHLAPPCTTAKARECCKNDTE
jgi:hypothetical protein